MTNGDFMEIDWFGISSDPERDPSKKCVFCKDVNRNPLEDPDSEANSYVTTDCRHLVCGTCAKNYQPGQVKCPLCGSKIQRYLKMPPEYLALRALNEIRKDAYDEWNLQPEDFVSVRQYNDFLESREQLVQMMLLAKSLEKESKTKYDEEIRQKRHVFIERHREAIARNKGKIDERLNRIRSEIADQESKARQFRKRIEEEKKREEMERIYKEQAMNEQRLGTTIKAPLPILSASRERKSLREEQKTYLLQRNDFVANNGPPPTVIERPKIMDHHLPAAMLFRAGGLDESMITQRTLSEMQAGWDMLA